MRNMRLLNATHAGTCIDFASRSRLEALVGLGLPSESYCTREYATALWPRCHRVDYSAVFPLEVRAESVCSCCTVSEFAGRVHWHVRRRLFKISTERAIVYGGISPIGASGYRGIGSWQILIFSRHPVQEIASETAFSCNLICG